MGVFPFRDYYFVSETRPSLDGITTDRFNIRCHNIYKIHCTFRHRSAAFLDKVEALAFYNNSVAVETWKHGVTIMAHMSVRAPHL